MQYVQFLHGGKLACSVQRKEYNLAFRRKYTNYLRLNFWWKVRQLGTRLSSVIQAEKEGEMKPERSLYGALKDWLLLTQALPDI